MGLSKSLWREKTRIKSRTPVTFNAPASYPIPYGKMKVTVSGRGGTGSPAQPSIDNSYYAVANYNYNWVETEGFAVPGPSGNFTYSANPPNYSQGSSSGSSVPAPTSGTFNSYPAGYFYDNANGNTSSADGAMSYNDSYSETGANYYLVPDSTPGSPATNGGPSSFLGQTWPGGYGGAGTELTNVPIAVPYSTTPVAVTVAPGGYVTINVT